MHCRSCDYNVSGSAAGTCPGCATAFDPADPASDRELPLIQVRRRHVAVGIRSGTTIVAIAWLGFHGGSPPELLVMVIALGVVELAAVVAGIRLRRSAASRAITMLILLPASGMLGLSYSLAMHMRRSFWGWPSMIGAQGFPSSLEVHARLATGYFSYLFLATLLALPVTFSMCLLVRRFPPGVCYLGGTRCHSWWGSERCCSRHRSS